MQRGFQEAVISRAGEMGSETPLPSSGRLEGASVPEILRLASAADTTGSLVFTRDGIQKVLYLREGRVVFAASRDPEDRLSHLLLRRGQVGLVPLLEASGEIATGRRLGEILVEHGRMTPDEVARAVLDQVRQIVLSVFGWRHGEWRYSAVSLPGDEPITLDVDTEELILIGLRRMQDWRWIRGAVGGPRAVYVTADPQPDGAPPFTLTERAIMDRLSTPMRVEELCDQVYAPSYDIYRSVWALAILGRLCRIDGRRVERRATRQEGGWLDARGGASALLLELGERRFSGVVRLFSGRVEGSVFMRDGRVAFATTRDPEKSLLAHLLRRGVISDRDHEDAVRRLISGKRVGTLLAERGVIDTEEIATFVREQVLDVAKTLALLDEGEYELEEGLPSQEDILLDRAPEEVVLAAIESSERFQAVWRSFGDLNVLFRLAPGHRARLDRMNVRPFVWEIVELLADERTLREILALRPEPDFEVCRLLHALERAKIVARVSQDEILRRARMAIQELSAAGGAMPTSTPAAEIVVEPDAPDASAGEAEATAGATEGAAEAPGEVVFDSGDDGSHDAASADGGEPAGSARDEAEAARHGEDAERPAETGVPDAAEASETEVDANFVAHGDAESAGVSEHDGAFDAPAHVGAPHEDDAAAVDDASLAEEPGRLHAEPLPDGATDAPVDAERADEGQPEPEASSDEAACGTWDEPGAAEPGEHAEHAEHDEHAEHAEHAEHDGHSEHSEHSGHGEGPEADEEHSGAGLRGESADEPAAAWPGGEVPPDAPEVTGTGEAGQTAAELAPELFDAPGPGVADETGDPDEVSREIPVEFASGSDEDAAPEADPARTVEMARDLVEAAVGEARSHGETEHGSGEDNDPTDRFADAEPHGPDDAFDAPASAGEDQAVDEGEEETDVFIVDPAIYEAVDRFNTRHAVVYRGLRPEIGAGIRNYVSTCCARLGEPGRVFDGVDLDDGGCFDRARLARTVAEHAPHDPSAPLEALIENEIATVRGFVAAARLEAIERELVDAEG